MAKEIINDGVIPNDGQGDNLRLGAQKINSNFDELYNALGNGETLSTISSNTVTATGGNKITFYFPTEGDLPNATTYDGMFAHVHADNTSRVAHSGTWIKLIQETSSIDMLSDVETSSPAPTEGQALVWSTSNSRWQAGTIDSGAGSFVSLADTPGSLASHNNKFVSVNSTANAIEFSTPSVDRLSDVDVTTTPPTAGQVLKWNGTNWIPGVDATSGGAGSDADTLDGLDSTYFLNYNNLTNKPTVATTLVGLTDTPANYTGAANRFVKVNNAGDGIVFSVASTDEGNLSELSDVTTIGDYYNVSNAVYTPASGVLVLTIGLHNLQVGHNIKIASNSIVFTCAQDSHATEHSYPRGSGSNYAGGKDPAYTSTSAITAVGTDSITVNVGISSNTTAHTFIRATDNCISVTEKSYSTSAASYTPATGVLVLTIGAHSIKTGHSVSIVTNSLTFTCAMDSHATNHTYPRASGSNAPGGADYVYNKPALVTETSSTTITVNVGISSNQTAHIFVSATANNIRVAPSHGDSLYFNGVSWVKQNGPISRYEITNDGNNNYVWEGPGFLTATNDPVMYMNRGHTYVLNNSSGGSHPFEIRVSNGGSAYTSGVTGDQKNTQVFKVPMDAPSTLYYQCTSHTAMGNTINIVS